jgi:hypothetical protein
MAGSIMQDAGEHYCCVRLAANGVKSDSCVPVQGCWPSTACVVVHTEMHHSSVAHGAPVESYQGWL